MNRLIQLLCTIALISYCRFFTACSGNEQRRSFELKIELVSDSGAIAYILTDSLLTVTARNDNTGSAKYLPLQINVAEMDSIMYVAGLDIKSYSCNEQHVLMVDRIFFTNDSGTVLVNPNINHPKELDMAVRIINSLVPDQYKLYFEDMQPAIEPRKKLVI